MRLALVGDPVAHSRSPAMHAAALRAMGLAHTYEAMRVTAEELPRVVAALRAGALLGVNVTVPHKRAALALADAVDPSAARSGSCNVLAVREGRVVAFDTDGAALADEVAALTGRRDRALVLGAGGAARSAVRALADLGFAEIGVRARRPEQAAALARALDAGTRAEPWAPSPRDEARTALVVQATSAGMERSGVDAAAEGATVAAVVAWDALGEGAVALDVVYAPPETPFLAAARARGLSAENGLGMLARQGARALELWLGRPAPLAAMRAALV